MITTLTGSNTFLLRQKLSSIVADFTKEHGAHELEQLDGEQTELRRVMSALESLPFLAEKKCLVIHKPQAIDGFSDNHESLLADIADNVEVVLVEPALDKRTKYAKFLQKHTNYLDFKELDEQQLVTWLLEAAKQEGATLNRQTAQYLISRVGTSQYTLFNELQKLAIYSNTITKQEVDLLTEQAPQSTIFELIDAVFSGRVERALQLYEDQRAQKIEPQKILYMMVRQVYIIAVVQSAPSGMRDDEIAKKAKLHPYVVQKARQSARQLDKQALRTCLTELRDIDRAQKTKTVQLDELIRSFIVTLSQLQRQ